MATTTADLTPNIPDGADFVSAPVAIPQNDSVSVQSYREVPFTVETSIDGVIFHPVTGIAGPGITRIDANGGAFLRTRAAVAGTSPYALFLLPL